MEEATEIHFDPREGRLTLMCYGAEYERIRAAIWNLVFMEEFSEVPMKKVKIIEIESARSR